MGIIVKNGSAGIRAKISNGTLAQIAYARQMLISLPSAKRVTLQGGDCEYWRYGKDEDRIVQYTLDGRTAPELQKMLVSRVVNDVLTCVGEIDDARAEQKLNFREKQ